MNAKFFRVTILGFMIFILTMTTPALAVPTIDGRFDFSEGYTQGFNVDFNIQGGSTATGGELWLHQDAATNDVFLAFIQPLTLIDNTYGANSIGWGASAPSGKHHNFDDITESDKAQFQFTDGLDTVVLDVVLDYFSAGSAGDVLAFGTSLDYNFNVLGYNTFTTDSPLTDSSYSDPLSAPGWIFDVIYEMQISGSVFGTNGFGGVTIPIVHDSPNKIGKNKVYPLIGDPIPNFPNPEPSSVILLGTGLAGLWAWRNRKRKATQSKIGGEARK